MNMTFEQIYNQMQWTRQPEKVEAKDGVIAITTKPHTDLWQRTYYHFRNDNAPVLQMKTNEALAMRCVPHELQSFPPRYESARHKRRNTRYHPRMRH